MSTVVRTDARFIIVLSHVCHKYGTFRCGLHMERDCPLVRAQFSGTWRSLEQAFSVKGAFGGVVVLEVDEGVAALGCLTDLCSDGFAGAG